MACKCGTPGCAGPADAAWIDRCIASEGWAGMGVMTGDGKPGFNYTIGLTAMGRPELVIFGLPNQVGHSILGSAIEHIEKVRDGAVLDEVATMPIAVRAVPSARANQEYLVQAKHYFGHEVEVLQLVWPDPHGLFPWQEGCLERMVRLQGGLIGPGARQDVGDGARPPAASGQRYVH